MSFKDFTILGILVLSLSSCVTSGKTVDSAGGNGRKLNPVYVTNSKKIDLLFPDCIEKSVKSVQLLEGRYGKKDFSLLCYLEADSTGIFISLFNEFGSGMGELSYDGNAVLFDSSVFPKNAKAEYIVSDLQMAYYSAEKLRFQLEKSGLTFETEISEKGETRRIFEKGNLIEEIKIENQKIVIDNFLRNYSYRLTEADE